MKKLIIIISLSLLGVLPSFRASAQADEIAQLVLNIEKLAQFKQILSDMKKGYQILEGGYNTVKNISEGNFSLHKAFLDGLMEVSPTVRNYRRVVDISNDQITLVKEYRKAYDRFRQDNNFNADELAYIGRVYDNLFKESLRNLDELLTVITAGKARMSDDERLQAIDRIYADMQDKLLFLQHFNNNTTILAVQRAKERNDAQTIRKIYGLNN
ncbi:TerB family tellurite resistance protein [Parafilimonas sp.]|uniref:TerB family tellurite resistance protein n=1 Tax=Parafilimonas sp. TaxID=1969739 RepID=UPI003F81138A